MKNQFNSLEQEIIHELNGFIAEQENHDFFGDRSWTLRIKERIGNLGLQKGFDVAASGFKDKFEGEWLFDMVWYEEDEDKRLARLPLAMESEWSKNYGAIKYDFEKLLVARAECKLMICQCNPDDTELLFSLLQEAVSAFKGSKGERYLIAILDSSTEQAFQYFSIVS